MRKIEIEMNIAIANGKNWNKDNTVVLADGTVYLHSNRIAYVNNFGSLVVDEQTLKNWPTNTTRSRLRALGFRIKGDAWIKG